MTWVFGSFLVTPCALASCHILFCNQEDDSAIRALGYNRCVTGRRPRDENQAVRFRQNAENRGRARDTKLIRGVSDELASVDTPWLQEEDTERRILLSENMSLHPSLTHHRNMSPIENKVWEIHIFIKK